MYLDKVNSADIVIRDDGCLWNCHNYLCKQLLYDGMHIRSSTLPSHRKKWVCLMDSEIVLDALKTHWKYICKIYQYASCFYEVRSIFENLYFSEVSSFRSFCMHFLSLCTWSLGLHVMHVPISEILWSFSVDDCFWWWIPSASARRSWHTWKQTFIDAFQKLVWNTMLSQIRVLIPNLHCRICLFQRHASHIFQSVHCSKKSVHQCYREKMQRRTNDYTKNYRATTSRRYHRIGSQKK